MNIRWFSPLDPGATEIARYSAQALPWLQRYAEVLQVADAAGDENPGWWAGPGEAAERAAGEDALPIYHIGNNPLHLPIHQLACREPGLVVLHDLGLVDLARHQSLEAGEPELWKEQMLRQYGEKVRELVNRSEKSPADYSRMIASYPLFLPFVENALGVVVHSRYAADAVASQLPDGPPVRQLYLPYPDTVLPCARDYQARPLRFVFCGHVGPNRRLLEFFEAWGSVADPAAIALEMYGNIHNRRQLAEYAAHFGVADYVQIRGYVEEYELEKALQSAHFAINLRWPTMGEASASQLRYWSAALPTLVTDVGWYGELPDDVVCKISAEQEIEDIAALLEDALGSPERYRLIGERGQAYLASAHGAQDYAQALAGFAAELTRRRLGFRMLDRELVTIIAATCADGSSTGLFRAAIETAVATFEPPPTEEGSL